MQLMGQKALQEGAGGQHGQFSSYFSPCLSESPSGRAATWPLLWTVAPDV